MIDIRAGRPATLSPNGMVTCPHALASQAGADVLRAGGSAVDAAVAASAALSVLYPHMTGIGGDAFWLIYDASDQTRALHRWRRPRDLARHARGLRQARPRRGALSRRAARHAHRARRRRELGRGARRLRPAAAQALPRKRDRLCARRLSGDGAARPLARARARRSWRKSPEAAAIFLKDGRSAQPTPTSRARWRPSPATAGTASTTARWRANWCATREPTTASSPPDDLKAQVARWGEPLKGSYRDVTIYETPAPTQGFAVLEMLNLLEPLELHRKPFLGPDYVHLMVQAKQLAYHDRDRHLADPRFADVPMERLISKKYADERRALMDPARALPWDRIPSYGSLAGDTVYIAAVDRRGQRGLADPFGSMASSARRWSPAAPAWCCRTAPPISRSIPSSPNRVEPGKTPLHTLIASLGFRERQALERAGLHGRRRPAADPPAGLHRHDRPRPRHPAGAGHAALPVRPLRARRGARHAAHRRPLPGRDHRRAGAARPHCSIAGATGTRWRATPTASPSIR